MTTAADLLNCGLEVCGGLLVTQDIRAILRARRVVGRSVLPMLFFTAWGVCNLYIYPSSGLIASAIGGAFLCAMNIVVLVLVARYRDRPEAA